MATSPPGVYGFDEPIGVSAIRLMTLDLRRVVALGVDATRIDGIPVVAGAMPPSFLLDEATDALEVGKSALWHAPLLFVDSAFESHGRIVGSGIFKSEPSEGWVEIGYAIAPECQRRGYATDAVFALVRLAFEQPDVRAVYAETAVANDASRRVVRKVGFTHVGQRFSEDDGLVDCWFVER